MMQKQKQIFLRLLMQVCISLDFLNFIMHQLMQTSPPGSLKFGLYLDVHLFTFRSFTSGFGFFFPHPLAGYSRWALRFPHIRAAVEG